MQRRKHNLSSALPGALAFAGVLLCTWGSFRLGQTFAFTGFLYLVFVVLAALYGGFWQATAISIAAAACLNYYFVPPIFSFANSPANWVALGAFEFTALIISRLSLRVRQQALEATAGQFEMERLYQTSRRILLMDRSAEPGQQITALIREVFELDAVELFDSRSGSTYQSGEASPGVAQRARDAYLLDSDVFDPERNSWFCVLRLGVRPVGGIALNGGMMSKSAATALASLSGIALERALALQREAQAQAARHTEQLRTAVLDALAHDFKMPLTVARTASSGLLALGGLNELQQELVSTIDAQATKLDHLASRLLTSARLDSTEFSPQQAPALFSHLAITAIGKLEQEADRARFRVAIPSGEAPVLADREMILKSFFQLVDNALKYSEPGSPIDVEFRAAGGAVVARVRSKGSVLAGSDCERVFERFYRAGETQHLPAGTGLGLSIVKKIVGAHKGRVWAEGEGQYGTSFYMSLPAAA